MGRRLVHNQVPNYPECLILASHPDLTLGPVPAGPAALVVQTDPAGPVVLVVQVAPAVRVFLADPAVRTAPAAVRIVLAGPADPVATDPADSQAGVQRSRAYPGCLVPAQAVACGCASPPSPPMLFRSRPHRPRLCLVGLPS